MSGLYHDRGAVSHEWLKRFFDDIRCADVDKISPRPNPGRCGLGDPVLDSVELLDVESGIWFYGSDQNLYANFGQWHYAAAQSALYIKTETVSAPGENLSGSLSTVET